MAGGGGGGGGGAEGAASWANATVLAASKLATIVAIILLGFFIGL
jgi:hypothetical protein